MTINKISFHLENIYKERELDELATTEDFSVVQNEKLYDVDCRVQYVQVLHILPKMTKKCIPLTLCG